MEAYFYNTRSGQTYKIQYTDFEIDGGGISVNYQTVDIPLNTAQYLYWQNTSRRERNVIFYMSGANTINDLKLIESFCYPHNKDPSPPVIKFKFANLPVMQVLFKNVSTQLNIYNSNEEYGFRLGNNPFQGITQKEPYRATADSLTTNNDKDTLTAFERFKDFLKTRIGLDVDSFGKSEEEKEYADKLIQGIEVDKFNFYQLGQWSRYFKTDLANWSDYKIFQAKVTVSFIELSNASNILSNR